MQNPPSDEGPAARGVQLYNAEFDKVNHGGTKIRPCSVDLIITKPSWKGKDLKKYSELGKFAYRVMKPTGFFTLFGSNGYLPEITSKLSEKLHYFWICSGESKTRDEK